MGLAVNLFRITVLKMTARTKKRGRPQLPDGELKRVYPLRLSNNELARFRKFAESQGKTVREWMMVALNGLIDDATKKRPKNYPRPK